MKKETKPRSYRYRLLLPILLVVFFVLTALTAYASHKSVAEAREHTLRISQKTLEQALNNIDYYLRDGETIARAIAIEPLAQNALADPETALADDLLALSYQMSDIYKKYLSLDPYVLRIFLVSGNRRILDRELSGLEEQVLAPLGYEGFLQGEEGIRFVENEEPLYVGARPAVSCMKKVYDLSTAQAIGNVVVDLDSAVFQQVFQSVHFLPDSNLYLLDAQDNLLFSREEFQPGSVPPDIPAGCAVLEAVSSYSGWRMLCVVREGGFALDRTIPYQLTAIVGGCFLLSVLLIWMIFNRGWTPVRNLVQAMRRLERGELGLQIPVGGRGEFAYLGTRFNAMSLRLKELMEESVRREALKKEAELYAMQAQITPHFLYNTLRTIRHLAHKGETVQVAGLLTDVIALFQARVKSGRELISLREELCLTEAYANIMRARYGDIFTLSVELPAALEQMPVPRFTVQPLVENAIFHGIIPKNGGAVRVEALSMGGTVLVKVSDDGAGIPPGRLTEINNLLQEPRELYTGDSGEHLGLVNVHDRILLQYGPGFGLTADSFPGTGTIITITMPQHSGEEEHP